MTNILLYITDDQRFDTLKFMPRLTTNFLPYAREFTRTYANTSVCQAARAGIFSGQYAKHHGVYWNDAASWNNGKFNPNNTVAKWLQDAGYRTGLIGKWHSDQVLQDPKPDGFTYWRSLKQADTVFGTYNFQVTDGTTHTTVNQYMGDWLQSETINFMTGSEPWFFVVAETAPHVNFRAHPDDIQKRSSYNHDIVDEDLSDKPSWVQSVPAPDPEVVSGAKQDIRRVLRYLLTADRNFDAICQQVDFNDTVVLYVSDNGSMWGEHRITTLGKYNFYEPAARLPLLARGPGFNAGKTDKVSAAHQDITRTICAVAGVSAPIPQDGIDLRDLQNNPSNYANRGILLEKTAANGKPAGNAIAKRDRKLMNWPGQSAADQYEMYDLDSDPEELTNVAYDSSRLTERTVLETELNDLLA